MAVSTQNNRACLMQWQDSIGAYDWRMQQSRAQYNFDKRSTKNRPLLVLREFYSTELFVPPSGVLLWL